MRFSAFGKKPDRVSRIAFGAMGLAAADDAALPDCVFAEIRKHHRWIRNFYDSNYWS